MREWGDDGGHAGWALRIEAAVLLALILLGIASTVAWALG